MTLLNPLQLFLLGIFISSVQASHFCETTTQNCVTYIYYGLFVAVGILVAFCWACNRTNHEKALLHPTQLQFVQSGNGSNGLKIGTATAQAHNPSALYPTNTTQPVVPAPDDPPPYNSVVISGFLDGHSSYEASSHAQRTAPPQPVTLSPKNVPSIGFSTAV